MNMKEVRRTITKVPFIFSWRFQCLTDYCLAFIVMILVDLIFNFTGILQENFDIFSQETYLEAVEDVQKNNGNNGNNGNNSNNNNNDYACYYYQ